MRIVFIAAKDGTTARGAVGRTAPETVSAGATRHGRSGARAAEGGRRRAGPALERAQEGAWIGVPERAGDLRDRRALVEDAHARDLFANGIDDLLKGGPFVAEAALQR